MKKLILISTFIIAFSFNSFAWIDTGHMLISKLCFQQLDKDAKKEAIRLIAVLNDAEPLQNDFVEAATWLDYQKKYGITFLNKYHYINRYFVSGPVASLPQIDNDNIISICNQSINTLNNPKSSDFAKAFSLRILLHCIGDIHQPMHCCSRVNQNYPDGDLGGNLFKLSKENPNNIRNLHKLWDYGVYLFPNIKYSDYHNDNNLLDKYIIIINNFFDNANDIKKECIENKIAKSKAVKWEVNKNIEIENELNQWVNESYFAATENAYTGIEENSIVNDAYITKNKEVCKERLYLASSRLAIILNAILIQE